MKTYFQNRLYTVTSRTLKAPRRRFVLRNVEKVQIRRPLVLAIAALTIATFTGVHVFADILYPEEILALLLSTQIGHLVLRSRVLGQDGTVLGWHRTLRKVHEAVEQALEDRFERDDREESKETGHSYDDPVH